MAKMFYTIGEAAAKLNMSEAEIKGLAESGQLQEFRDQDRLMFKVEQVDMLAGGQDEDEGDLISLSDSVMGGDASASGSDSIGLEDTGGLDGGGISIFDADPDATEADPAAATQISDRPMAAADFSFDSASSGSGLADLALETDDTSLGQELMDDVYAGDDSGSGSAIGQMPAGVDSGDLFESTPATSGAVVEPQGVAVMGGMAAIEPYDGAWSGILMGFAVGMVLALLAGIVFVVMGISGAGVSTLIDGFSSTTMYIIAGGALGVMLIGAGIGYVVMRKS